MSDLKPAASPQADFMIQPEAGSRTWLNQIAAIAAVLLVVVGMSWGGDAGLHFMATSFNEAFGSILMDLGYPNGSETAVDPDFTEVARVNAEFFAYQYGGVVAVLLLLGLVRGRLKVRDLGLSRGRRSLGQLIVMGIVAGAVANIASTIIFAGKELFELGNDTPFWWALDRVDWDWDLWLFMAVGSYALVPIVEEFAYRGGMLGSLARAFAPGAALLGIGILFAVMHSQYWSIGPIGIITLFSVVYAGAIFGYVFLRTGSLLPAIIAHAMVNIPVALEFEWVRIGLTVVVIWFAHKHIWQAMTRIAASLWSLDTLRLAGLAGLVFAGFWLATVQFALDRKVIEIAVFFAALAVAFLARRQAASAQS